MWRGAADIEITAFYCVCDDLLKSLTYQDHYQCRMSAAEVMTAALTAAAFFGGDSQHMLHAVTHQGFELKVFLFALAYGIEKAINLNLSQKF